MNFRTIGLCILVVLVVPELVGAVDQPISANRLRYRDRGSADMAVLEFVAADPNMLFPAVGSAGDPSKITTSMSITVFTRHGASGVQLSSGSTSGWKTLRGAREAYLYGGPAYQRDEFAKIVYSQGIFKLRLRGVELEGPQPFGPVAVRFDTGFLFGQRFPRNCALFESESIRLDQGGMFYATAAPVPTLADCSDESIIAALGIPCGGSQPSCGGTCPGDGVCTVSVYTRDGCACISPRQPCGDTAPLCSGECGEGEQCIAINTDLPAEYATCVCSRVEQIPCGAIGGSYCPEGFSCQTVPGRYGNYSTCVSDDAVCGQPDFGSCPPGLECRPFTPPPDIMWSCLPFFCGTFFPTCNRSCPTGLQCSPLSVGEMGYCICVDPQGGDVESGLLEGR